MPGKLVLAVGKIFGEIDEDGDNGWVTPIPAAGPQSSASSFFLEEDELRCGTCSGTGLTLSHQCRPHLGQCPCLVWTWVQSTVSLLFPRHSQVKSKPSFTWHPCLGAKPGVMAAPQGDTIHLFTPWQPLVWLARRPGPVRTLC